MWRLTASEENMTTGVENEDEMHDSEVLDKQSNIPVLEASWQAG